jgi:gamma-glutamylcyclotransferase (GGCT)/AIG2-like uncharacterized protein YtfP
MTAHPGSLLFVYGTLRRAVGAPVHALFQKHARFFDDGHIGGSLYDLGNYPGLVPSTAGSDWVRGEVYVLRTPQPSLRLLDRYEGVEGTRSGEPAQYARLQLPVTTRRHGRVSAWTYVYLLEVADGARIVSGDYVLHLRGRRGVRLPNVP